MREEYSRIINERDERVGVLKKHFEKLKKESENLKKQSNEPRRINPIMDPIGSDQPTKFDGTPGNESTCTNGSDGSALFSL